MEQKIYKIKKISTKLGDGKAERVKCEVEDKHGKMIKLTVFLNDGDFLFSEGEKVEIVKMKQGEGRYINEFSTGLEYLLPLDLDDIDEENTTGAVKPTTPPIEKDDIDKWQTYLQRLKEINDLWEGLKETDSTAHAGAILGLRNLMGI